MIKWITVMKTYSKCALAFFFESLVVALNIDLYKRYSGIFEKLSFVKNQYFNLFIHQITQNFMLKQTNLINAVA